MGGSITCGSGRRISCTQNKIRLPSSPDSLGWLPYAPLPLTHCSDPGTCQPLPSSGPVHELFLCLDCPCSNPGSGCLLSSLCFSIQQTRPLMSALLCETLTTETQRLCLSHLHSALVR